MKAKEGAGSGTHPFVRCIAGEDGAGVGPQSEESEGERGRGAVWVEGAKELLALLRILGEGYRLLCMYKCREAADMFMKLPRQQYATGWVLCQVRTGTR